MAYDTEAMIPAEVRVPSFRYENFDEKANEILLAAVGYDRREARGGSGSNGRSKIENDKIL